MKKLLDKLATLCHTKGAKNGTSGRKMKRALGLVTLAALFLFYVPNLAAQELPGRAQAFMAARSAVAVEVLAQPQNVWVKVCTGWVYAKVSFYSAAHCFLDRVNMRFRVSNFWGSSADVASVMLDVPRDIAIATLVAELDARPSPLAQSVQPGDYVWYVGSSLGNPLAVATAVVGRVELMKFANTHDQLAGTAMQETLVLNGQFFAGNSGAGLYNYNGEVVGMFIRCQEVRPQICAWGYALSVNALREAGR